jgi:hypothetical protein
MTKPTVSKRAVDLLLERAIKAIREVHADTSVSVASTLERLLELREGLDSLIAPGRGRYREGETTWPLGFLMHWVSPW